MAKTKSKGGGGGRRQADKPVQRPPEKSRSRPQTLMEQKIICPFCNSARVANKHKHGPIAYYRCLNCCDAECQASTFQVIVDRRASAMLRDGEWSGKKVVIVGGGATVDHYDLRRCISARVKAIALNHRWKDFEKIRVIPELLMSGDQLFWKQAFQGTLRERFLESTSIRVAVQAESRVPKSHVFLVEGLKEWGESIEDGVLWRGNSGLAALNLADELGAEVIELVGFDLDGTGHNGQVDEARQRAHAVFLDQFREAAEHVKARVLVANPRSPLCDFWEASPA